MKEATAKILPFKAPTNTTGHPAPSAICRDNARNKRIELTVQEILDIEPSGAEKDFLWDSIVRGFGAYKTNTGICSYLVKRGNFRRVLGQLDDPKWPTTPAANIKAARAEAYDLIRKFEAGENISKSAQVVAQATAAPHGVLTVAEAYAIYMAKRRSKKRQHLRPGTHDTYGSGFKYLAPWHNRELWSITKDEVTALAEQLWKLGRKKGSAVRHGLGLFTYIWNYFSARSKVARPKCPTEILEADNLWPPTPVRDRNLVTNEDREDLLAAWWRALDDMLVKTNSWGDAWWTFTWVVFFKAVVLTGTRRSEMHYAEWKNYNEETGMWLFPGVAAEYDDEAGAWSRKHGKFVGTKAGRDHKAYVGPYLAKLLKKYRAWQREQYKGDHPKGNLYVFGDVIDNIKPDDPSNAVAQFRKVHPELKAFLWSSHDLRHTFESVAGSEEMGEVIPWKALQMLLNHEVEKKNVTARYIHVSAKNMRHYAKLIESEILKRAEVKA